MDKHWKGRNLNKRYEIQPQWEENSFRDIGIAYAQQGDAQQACQMAMQALALTKQTKSLSVLERVRIILAYLKDQEEVQEAKELESMLDRTATLILV